MIERDFDSAIITLEEDELQGMIETRQTLDIGSKEYTLLTNAADKAERTLNETYKVIYAHQEKIKDLEETAKFRQAELKLKEEQHKAEMALKEKQYQEELKIRQAEMDQREVQFKAEMEQKEQQHKAEMEQKTKENKSRCIWTFVGVGVTATVGLVTAVVTKKMDFKNYEYWMPIITAYEKDDSFTYSAGRIMSRAILKQ